MGRLAVRGSSAPRRTGVVRLGVLAVLGAGVLALMIAMALGFAWPSEGRAPSVAVGHIDDFAPGSVTHVNTGVQVYFPTLLDAGERPAALWVVRYEDGSVAVFSAYDPRTGCTLPWRESTTVPGFTERSFFQDPCHGSSYTLDGRRVYGPSPRDMDRFEFTVHASGTVEVHLGEFVAGEWRVSGSPPSR